MSTPYLAAALLLVILTAPAAHSANPARGKLMYENWCHHCHLTEIHYRVNSKVDSWGELVHMVASWQAEMQLGWRAEDIADVASYLNWRYYRFPVVGIE